MRELGDILLSAEIDLETNISLTASLGEITVNISVKKTLSDGAGAWWWHEYVARHLAERRAPRIAEGWALAPSPVATGQAYFVLPRGGEATAPSPFGFAVADVGAVAAADAIVEAPIAFGAAFVGAQAWPAFADILPTAAGLARTLVIGEARAAISLEMVGRAVHSRLAIGRACPLQISASGSGEVGYGALGNIEFLGVFARGDAAAGAFSSGATIIAPTASGAAFIGVAGDARIALAAVSAVGQADHDPDDEKALTAALLALVA